jgi:hypothetical protein
MTDLPEIFFAGASILPGVLAFAGDLVLSLGVMILLMALGCLSSVVDPEAPFRTVPVRGAPGKSG